MNTTELEGQMRTIVKVQKTTEDELERAKAEVRILSAQVASLEVDTLCMACEDERRCVQLLPCNHTPYCRACYATYRIVQKQDALSGTRHDVL